MKIFNLLFYLFFILHAISVKAQDVIVKMDNSTILSKVEEVSDQIVKFRKWNNLDGPIYVLNISEIMSINYSNGVVDVFRDKTICDNNVKKQDTINYSVIPAIDNEEQKAKYNVFPKLNIKTSAKKSKEFFPIMAFTEESIISTNEITIVISPDAVEFYEGGWKVKIGYLIGIVNKTDNPIYIDRANSYRIFNDKTSKFYWDNKQFMVSHGNGMNANVKVFPGVNIGSSSTSSYTENHEIDRFIIIPPHSYANLSDYKYIRLSETRAEFKLLSDIEYWGFSLFSSLPINVGEVKSYSEDDTPYTNKYNIAYSTDPEFKRIYNLQFELYAKWLVGAKLPKDTWSNLSPEYRIVKKMQQILPDFWENSLVIIGMPGIYK